MAVLKNRVLFSQLAQVTFGLLSIFSGPIISIIIQHLVDPMLIVIERYDYLSDKFQAAVTEEVDSYDFIIVGAGSSGCTLAHFLSQEFSVLLLESGGDVGNNLFVHMPVDAYGNMDKRALIYPHKTTPQTSASFGCNDNRTAWPAGKGLGGSSFLNGMIYIRGNNIRYDDIAERVGDPRWRLKNILKNFQEIENYRGRFNKDEHGSGGGMSIEGGYSSPFIPNLLRAGNEFNLPTQDPNPNGPLVEGVQPADFYMKGGRRWNAYDGFIRPILSSRNLTVIKYANVKKVLMNGVSAYGVKYDRHGVERLVFAKKEVVLSAGATSTPKILMLSGIGDRQHLSDLKIPLKISLPVGNNLQDKYGALIGPFYIDKGLSFRIRRDFSIPNFLKWLFKGKGPLTSSKTEATFAKSSSIAKAEGTENNPDIHSYIISITPDDNFRHFLSSGFNFNEKVLDYLTNTNEKYKDSDAFYQLVCVSSPQGTGTLRLQDTDPYSPPLLDPKYLQHERDVKVLTEGLNWAVDLVENSESFNEINAIYNPEPHPDCRMHIYKSNSYYECLGRHSTMTAFKYGGTVPIGRSSGDKDACVDSHFRVIGAKGLRVIDGSVLQEKYVSVNDAVCRMLGKLGSDIIKADWKQ